MKKSSGVKILIGGDFAARNVLSQRLIEENYSDLDELKYFIKASDCFTIVNLECPVIHDTDKPIYKYGPNLGAPKEMIDALKYVGVDMVTLANNHILDYGDTALNRTITLCHEHDILTVGAGMDSYAAARPAIVEIKGKSLGIINCCEHEFSIPNNDHSAGANELNVIRQYSTIRSLKHQVDKVLVIVHGGHEFFNLPSPRMQETYRFFIDAGADAVVNHHQHCFSGYEIYNGSPIFYGLGNLVFETKSNGEGSWNRGYMVTIELDETINFSIHPYRQCVDGINFEMLPSDSLKAEIEKINGIISNPDTLKVEVEEYYRDQMLSESLMLEPYTNRYLRFFRFKKWIPSLIGKRFRIGLRNHIECESHFDKLRYYLSHK